MMLILIHLLCFERGSHDHFGDWRCEPPHMATEVHFPGPSSWLKLLGVSPFPVAWSLGSWRFWGWGPCGPSCFHLSPQLLPWTSWRIAAFLIPRPLKMLFPFLEFADPHSHTQNPHLVLQEVSLRNPVSIRWVHLPWWPIYFLLHSFGGPSLFPLELHLWPFGILPQAIILETGAVFPWCSTIP